MSELTIKQKKQKLLHELMVALRNDGFHAEPTFILGPTCITIGSAKDLGERLYTITLDNLSTVKVVVNYVEFPYENTIDSKRDANKTAKDIFEFSHELQAGDHSRMSVATQKLTPPRLALYYRNAASHNCVIVTSTHRFSVNEFMFNSGEKLMDIHSKLESLTKIIATDNEGAGRELRWEREVKVGPKWWSH